MDRMRYIALSVLALNIAVSHSSALARFDEKIQEADQILKRKGVTEDFSPGGVESLAKFIRAKKQEFQLAPQRVKKRASPFFDHAEKLLERAESERPPHMSYQAAKRALYAAWSFESSRPEWTVDPLRRTAEIVAIEGEIAKRLRASLARRGETSIPEKLIADIARRTAYQFRILIPYVERPDRSRPIGRQQAALEALHLFDTDGQLLSKTDLARLTPEQISELDIHPEHTLWYTRSFLEKVRKQHLDPWEAYERWLEKELRAQQPNFSIQKARRVLFFNFVLRGATSAKISAQDAYGNAWTIKWSDEIQPEVVSSRLWAELGAKTVDLVYANGPGEDGIRASQDDGLILVLPRVSDPQKGECHPVTVEQFKRCLLDSRYRYNIAPNLWSEGVIDEGLAKRLAKRLRWAEGKNWEQELLGRSFVTFRESLVEFFQPGEVIQRGGAAAFSSLGARTDRVHRGLLLYNMWVANRDAKDDNGNGYLLRHFPHDPRPVEYGDSTWTFLESQHDVGFTLSRSLYDAGELNGLKSGRDFVDLVKARPRSVWSRLIDDGRTYIAFKESLLYIPASWLEATYSDLLWMAKKIVGITPDRLREIVSKTNWPDFMRETLVRHLARRQKRFAEVFGLQDRLRLSDPAYGNLTIVRSYAGVDDISREFSLPAETVERYLHRHERVVWPAGQALNVTLVKDGLIQTCEQSPANAFLLDLLEGELYPMGLSRRLSRFVDDQDNVGCKAARSEPQRFLDQYGFLLNQILHEMSAGNS